ncbi:MAG: class I SAM-dependent methyltransferase [Vicinamibacterales bacterium]
MQRHVDVTATVKRHDWESTLSPLLGARTETLWRRHSDAVNSSLIAQWLPAGTCRHLLKTDLFDEAMGDGLYPLLITHATRVTGLDIAPSVLAAAAARHPHLNAVAADTRRLPFADATFDVVVSNSTLDHFDARDDIRIALRGLHRVLRPGGTLVLTLDNLANPLVALRNALPARLLRRLGLIDYPVGVTCGPWRLRRLLRESGFVVLDSTALLHCLRVFEVAALRRMPADLPSVKQARILRRLARWERLAGWPTRFITGHYVGVCARKV